MYRLDELARLVDGKVDGDPAVRISGVALLGEATTQHISMAADTRFLQLADDSEAGALLVAYDAPPMSRPMLRVARPRVALQRLLTLFAPPEPRVGGIHPQAVIGADVHFGTDISIGAHAIVGDGAVLSDGVTIYPGVFIGHGVHIGPGSTVYANAVLERGTRIGARCRIRANAVLGADGYGFISSQNGHERIPHVGGVYVGDDVEIGACTTVDKGTIGDTRVGTGTKLGNNVIIGHNVQIGQHCLVVGGTAIAGSVTVGDGATLAGVVAVADHVHVGDKATVGAQSLVTKDVPHGTFVSGTPARAHHDTLRQKAAIGRVPRLLHRVRGLEQQIEALRAQIQSDPDNDSGGTL